MMKEWAFTDPAEHRSGLGPPRPPPEKGGRNPRPAREVTMFGSARPTKVGKGWDKTTRMDPAHSDQKNSAE